MIRLAAAILALVLGYAGVADNRAWAGLFDDVKNAFSGDATGTHLEQLQPDAEDQATCGGNGNESLLNARVEQGLGVVNAPDLSAYLDGVMGRLVAASPFPKCRVIVRVTPHATVQAVALADGGVLIAIGFLRNLKNEDEVAALLAHELSHILMEHHASDAFVEAQDKVLKGMDAANIAGGELLRQYDPGLQRKVESVTAAGDAAYGVSESMIAPAWTRDQEDEADFLGTDLLVAAGYNPRAMAAVLQVVGAHEARHAAVEAEREALTKPTVQQALSDAANKTNLSDGWSILDSVTKVVSATADSVTEATQQSHRPASEREKAVKDYTRQFHKKQRRRAYKTEPWTNLLTAGSSGETFDRYRKASEARRLANTGGDPKQALSLAQAGIKGRFSGQSYFRLAFAEVRLQQGDRKKAERNLELAMNLTDPPWHIFRAQADMQTNAGDKAGAAATIERADALFGRPLGIAPYAIRIHRTAGNTDAVMAYLKRCDDSGKRAHLAACLSAAGLTNEQYQKKKLTGG